MSRFFSEKFASLTPYTPGEQPQDRQYVKLNTNESPFPPSPRAQAYAKRESEKLELYSDPECRVLVDFAAPYFGVEKSEILFTNGSDEILNFAFMAFCDKNHPAYFPDVTYGFYSVFAELNGVPYTEIPLKDDFSVALEDYYGLKGTIFLANPNAPTGIFIPVSKIEALLQNCPEAVVVVDEAYVDFGGESCLPLIHKYDNLLVTQTFSKSRSLAGGRLGFGAGCEGLIQDLNTIKYSTNPYNVNRMTMFSGLGALEDHDYFVSCCKSICETREWAAAELKKLGFTVGESRTNFLFPKCPAPGGKALYLTLKERGILVRHFDKPRLRDYLRITVGSRTEMEALLGALREILEENV